MIAAGGVVMALLAHAGVYTTPSGAPILNGITTLVKMGEMAVKLDRIMGGTFTSKRLQYAPPAPTRSPRSANTTAPTSIRRSSRSEDGAWMRACDGDSGRVRGEHRVLRFGPPAALREDAFARHAFALHADLPEHADAG